METIENISDYKIEKKILQTIRGGGKPTGVNSDNMYTDYWEDTNEDGKYGVGDKICFTEPFCCVE